MRRATILTAIARPPAVAALCVFARLEAIVAPYAGGTVVFLDLPAKPVATDWDISELLGESQEPASAEAPAAGQAPAAEPDGEPENAPAPDGESESAPETDEGKAKAIYAAQTFSRASEVSVVLLMAETGEDVGIETGLSGQVSAQVYENGKFVKEVPAGLVIAPLDYQLEQVILGAAAPGDLEGAIDTATISKKEALAQFKTAMRPFPGPGPRPSRGKG